MPRTTPSNTQTHENLLSAECADPEFVRHWQRLAPARAVAAQLIRFRSENGLSQKDLAQRLGLRQPNVARLESAEHEPSLDTLAAIADVLGIEFVIRIAPRSDSTPGTCAECSQEHFLATHTTARGSIRFSYVSATE